MKTSITFALAFLLFASLGYGQTGEIKGKVFDSQSKEPLYGANVFTKVGTRIIGATTDMNGNFTIKPLPSGIYNIYSTFIGYDTTRVFRLQVYPERITFIDNLALNESSKMLKELIITPSLIEKDYATTLKRDDIVHIPFSGNLPDLLSKITSDVQVGESGESHFRGARSGDEAYYIDGVKQMDDNVKIPSAAIKNMIVYSGGIPAKYGDLTGGCVVVETMSYFDWLNMQQH